jgi:hypothetical protein
MPQQSHCGLSLPLDATYDFAAWMKRPADSPSLPMLSLKEKNRLNLATESRNDISIRITRQYQDAIAAGTSLANMDIGLRLEAYMEYSDQEKQLLVSSRDLCDAVGPLPPFMVEFVALWRFNIAKDEADEKAKREKERSDRELEKQRLVIPSSVLLFWTTPMSSPPLSTAPSSSLLFSSCLWRIKSISLFTGGQTTIWVTLWRIPTRFPRS